MVARLLTVLVLALLPAWGGRTAVAHAQEDGAGLTLHLRACPPDYAGTDHYRDCHDRPLTGGYVVSLSGPAASPASTTDAAGNVAFAGLAPGTYQVYGGPPARRIELRVFCAPADTPGAPVPFAPGDPATNSRMGITLAAGDDVVCDWYFLPATAPDATTADGTATLTIHRRLCPADFFGPDFYGVCHGHPQTSGVELFLSGAAERIGATDAAGDVVFAALPPGRYGVLDSQSGGDFTVLLTFCAPASAPGTPFPAGLGLILLAAGDDVVCDWYYTNPGLGVPTGDPPPTLAPPPPLGSGTTLTISSWLCPPDLAAPTYAAACASPAAGTRFLVLRAGGGETVAGADGIVRRDLAALPSGPVSVIAFLPETAGIASNSVVACAGEDDRPLQVMPASTLSGGNQVTIPVAAGETTRCDWYLIPIP